MKININWLRWTTYILAGILLRLIINFIFELVGAKPQLSLFDFGRSIGIFIFLMEGLRWISLRLDRYVLWTEKPFKRFWVQLGVSLLFAVVFITLLDWAYPYFVLKIPIYVEWQIETIWQEILLSNIIALLCISSVIGLELGSFFLDRWRNSLIELERFKKENIKSQFEVLKSNISPHFLFNSLNTLASLIYVDQDAATAFIRELSKVYRYVLENKDKETIWLEEELDVLNAYLFLIETRFKDKFSYQMSIPPPMRHKRVAPMVLQMLIENAIKHNVISVETPLQIELFIDNNEYLTIQNNLKPKSSKEYTAQTGLNNIINRYHYLTDQSVQISRSNGKFIVKIPLLDEE